MIRMRVINFYLGLALCAATFTCHFPAKASVNELNDKVVTARFYVDTPSYEVQIKSKIDGTQVHWKPNVRALTGVDAAIRGFLTLGIGWANNVASDQATIYGDSTYTDYRIGINFPWLHGEANYQLYKGMYLDNTTQINPAITSGVKIQDKEFQSGNISLNATVIKEPKDFSYVAAIGQSERQESSGGSLLFGLALSQTTYDSPTGLIPTAIRSHYGEDQNIKNAKFYSGTLKIGYGYTFVGSKYWFFSMALSVGAGGGYRQYTDGITTSSSSAATYKGDLLVSFGYNGEKFLAAFILTADNTEYTTQSLQLPTLIADGKFALGWHF